MFEYRESLWDVRVNGSALVLKFKIDNETYYDCFSSLESVKNYIDDHYYVIRGEYSVLTSNTSVTLREAA